MVSVEQFLQSGYKKFSNTLNNGDYGLQRKVVDDKGIRYFITVTVYEYEKYRFKIPDIKPFGFQPEVQFSETETSPCFDVIYHVNEDTTVKDIEQFFDRIWLSVGQPYDELNFSEESA